MRFVRLSLMAAAVALLVGGEAHAFGKKRGGRQSGCSSGGCSTASSYQSFSASSNCSTCQGGVAFTESGQQFAFQQNQFPIPGQLVAMPPTQGQIQSGYQPGQPIVIQGQNIPSGIYQVESGPQAGTVILRRQPATQQGQPTPAPIPTPNQPQNPNDR